ncbi:MAG: hypothetical protein H6620_11840 [Halobacteriovoraceae bacterium]|nr:hypothetical protein [Halobacteriovoraceae bacterium]
MLAQSDSILLAQKADSINNIKYNLRQVSPEEKPISIEEKVLEYFEKHPEKLKSLEKSEEDYIASLPLKKRKRYKARRWVGHSYGVTLIVHTAYIFQAYHFAYGVEGKPINPSKATLAEEIGICIRTLDKALKILRAMRVISWKSGKQTWETNTYYLADAYKSTPMRKPEGFKHPYHLWIKQHYLINKQKLKEFTRVLFEHSLGDIADHLLRRKKKVRTSSEEEGRNAFKSAKDPPTPRKKPPNWHFLKDLKLDFKDQWVLSRYSECVLRQAIDDLSSYKSWGKKVDNVPAFLISRCKGHLEKNEPIKQKTTPTNIREWLSSYFKSRRNRFVFIRDRNQINLATSDSRPFIQLMWHKHDIQKSILKVYQKVQGIWIDKVFDFRRPDLAEAVEAYLECSVR